MRVAQRAAELLVDKDGASVLMSDRCRQALHRRLAHDQRTVHRARAHRARLVSTADAAARLGAAPVTSFVHGGIGEVEWERFDAFYFFNPFSENLYSRSNHLDDSVELSRARFRRDVDTAYRGLERARPGAGSSLSWPRSRASPELSVRGARGGRMDVLELWVRSDGGVRRHGMRTYVLALPGREAPDTTN